MASTPGLVHGGVAVINALIMYSRITLDSAVFVHGTCAVAVQLERWSFSFVIEKSAW